MFFSLKLAQLLQEEGLQYLRSPPPVWLTRHLIGEGQNLQFCKLRWHLNKSAADQSWQLIPQTLNATLGTCQRISLRSSQKVLHDFVDGTECRSWSNLLFLCRIWSGIVSKLRSCWSRCLRWKKWGLHLIWLRYLKHAHSAGELGWTQSLLLMFRRSPHLKPQRMGLPLQLLVLREGRRKLRPSSGAKTWPVGSAWTKCMKRLIRKAVSLASCPTAITPSVYNA